MHSAIVDRVITALTFSSKLYYTEKYNSTGIIVLYNSTGIIVLYNSTSIILLYNSTGIIVLVKKRNSNTLTLKAIQVLGAFSVEVRLRSMPHTPAMAVTGRRGSTTRVGDVGDVTRSDGDVTGICKGCCTVGDSGVLSVDKDSRKKSCTSRLSPVDCNK